MGLYWTGVLGIGVCGVLGYFLYYTPTLSIIPPEKIAGAVIADMPPLDPAKLGNPEQAAMVERGQYLYKNHIVQQLSRPKWERRSENQLVSCRVRTGLAILTPDPKTGIGSWSDKEIGRAIRSGMDAGRSTFTLAGDGLGPRLEFG